MRWMWLVAGAVLCSLPAWPASAAWADDDEYDLLYVPTPEVVVKKMLEMAKVTDKDVVYDLGCGDGRIVCMAAKLYKAKGVGIDLNPERIADCKKTLKKYGFKEKDDPLVEIRLGDALKVKDLERATVVTLYMLPEFMKKLHPIAKARLKPGTRIVSHDFTFDDWEPDQVIEFRGPEKEHTLYLYTVPAKKN